MSRRCTVFDEVYITKCYKCQKEMSPISDTAWRKHYSGEKRRITEFLCAECRVYANVDITDYSECIDLEGDDDIRDDDGTA